MKKYNIEYSKESKQDLIGIKQYIKYNLQEPEVTNKLISIKNIDLIFEFQISNLIRKICTKVLLTNSIFICYLFLFSRTN